jgi:hypothetical protein
MKDWEDLRKLHWTCIMEQNRIRTRLHEMKRLKAGYGATEAGNRLNCVSLADGTSLLPIL